jgi:hypothetical protein
LHKVVYPLKEDARRRSQTELEIRWIKDTDLSEPALIRQAELGHFACDGRIKAAERQIESDESDGWGACSDDGSEDSRSISLSERENSVEGREESEGKSEGEGQDDVSGRGIEPPAKRRRGAGLWGPTEACPDLGAGWIVQVRSGGHKRYSSPEDGCFFSRENAQDYLHTKAGAGPPLNVLAVRPEFPEARRCLQLTADGRDTQPLCWLRSLPTTHLSLIAPFPPAYLTRRPLTLT